MNEKDIKKIIDNIDQMHLFGILNKMSEYGKMKLTFNAPCGTVTFDIGGDTIEDK